MKTKVMLIAVIVMITTGSALADWPQYLGPQRNAISPEKGLLRSWPEEGPKVLWTISLGAGYGGAAVSDGKVYILDRIGNDKDALRCLDLTIGKELWSYTYDAPGRVQHPGSRSTPAIDGNYVYTCGSFGDLYCIDKNTHKPVWNKNIWKDYESGSGPRWAISQNPLIYGDSVIVASQTSKAGVVAYDKLTGRVKWASPALPGGVGYVSPKIVKINGNDNLVMITAGARSGGGGAVIGMDPNNGRQLWTYEGWSCRIPIPNVTEIGEGRLFITGGYEAGSAMIKITKTGDSYAVTELYKTDGFGTHCHPAVLHKGHLYAHCTTNTRRDGMVCMSIDGKIMWKTGRSPVFDKGGFILVDGLILSVDGREGILYLIDPNPAGYKELAKAKLLDTNECWGPLALVDDKLLIRDQKQMRCVVVK
ncbi:MAG: PQQ-binding-like beta-propeller repeat protein [Sedimentisphaerales bacterium]|nr:PQQ-binding-like beta-propeller repeat protein [Sedimentisphaerales bacterium]